MLNRTSKIIVTVFSVIVLVSCNGKEEVNPGYLWGETECFNDFLWKKYKPDTLYQNIRLDFNEDAQMTVSFFIFLKKKHTQWCAFFVCFPYFIQFFINHPIYSLIS